MKTNEQSALKKLLFHSPRVLTILIIIFLIYQAGLAFDDPVYSFWQKLLSFSIKLIIPALMVVALAISWKREFQGGIIFIILGVAFLLLSWNFYSTLKLLVIGGLLIFIGVVFLISSQRSGE